MRTPTKLFDAFQLGPLALSNRVVMAPLTCSRARPPGMVPSLLAAEYSQRASAGLIITEASQISPQDQGGGYFFMSKAHAAPIRHVK
jgi:N-ethylmaleimide reductase